MEKEIVDKENFWKESSPEVQDKNFDIFISLIEDYKNNGSVLMIFNNSNKSILEKHGEELVKLMNKYKEYPHLNELIWESLGKQYQKENKSILLELVESLINEGESIYEVWRNTNKETQSEILNLILERYNYDINVVLQILKGTNVELSKEQFEVFLERVKDTKEDNKINTEQAFAKYKQLFKINKNINRTVNLKIFNSSLLEIFDTEKLARITIYPEIQSKIMKLSTNRGLNRIFTTISKDDNWIMELDNILKNIDNYPQLAQNISKEDIDEETAQMLIQVFSQKENYFNISNISETKKYFDIRKEICQKILNNEEVENLNPVIAKYSEEDKKRFAILEMMYGIDIEEAENLVQKYGKDIEDVVSEKYASKTIVSLIGIKRILECKNIQDKYNENKSIIDKELETIEYSTIANLETNYINLYTQIYDEILYKPKDEDIVSETEYQGTKIKVYELTEDFNIFARAEGACNGWQEPENFADIINTPRTEYHGNCKSFIAQDLISIAQTLGVKFAYTKCEKGSLFLAAPWDMMSNDANLEFSTASTKWNGNNGIQFRDPRKTINNTRYAMNEFVSENLVYDKQEEKFKGDEPQYVLYLQEPEIDRETDDLWRMSKKAASQIGIDILIIDREKFTQKEFERLKELEAIFLGEKENEDNIPETEILESIIVKFENNSTGVGDSEILRNKYFTPQQRNEIIGNIWTKIKSLETKDFDKYVELLNKFTDVIENEEAKTYTNTGFKITTSRYGEKIIETLKQKQKETEEKSKNNKCILMKKYGEFGIEKEDISNIIEFIKEEKEEKMTNVNENVI